ncbi:MAG: hypothetical protein M3381_13250 [Actinomycetota bacterium]|nr:hypothetical protein [Actinomycetota bacterium]
MNLLLGDVETEPDKALARVGPWEIPVPAGIPAGKVVVGIRPEHLGVPEFVAAFDQGAPAEVVVDEAENPGGVSLLHFTVDAQQVDVRDDDGSDAAFTLGPGPATVIAAVDPRTQAVAGSRLTLAVDSSRIRFFDAVTGLALRVNGDR